VGAVVTLWVARSRVEMSGVVVEVVNPQKFPRIEVQGAIGLDYRTRYVVQTEKRTFIRAFDELEVIAL
jgi:hypothetical protein